MPIARPPGAAPDRADGRASPGRHWAQNPGALIAVTVLLFGGIAALRVVTSSPRDAVGVLFVVPIAALAARFGTRGGLAAALVALVLVAITSIVNDEPVTTLGYLTRATAFVLVGLALGLLSERVDRARRFELHQIDFSPIPIIEADEAGVIVRANKAVAQLLALSRDELVGQPVERFVPEHLRPAYEQLREAYFADPRFATVSDAETAVRGSDGTEIPVIVDLSPVPVASGVLVRVTLIDIREKVELEKALRRTAHELERSNAELEQFASVASHDLQEPLHTLASYAQLLRRRHGEELDPEDAEEVIDGILDSATRMQGLINDLLTYSRIGWVDLNLETFEAKDLVEEVRWSLASAIDVASADVVVHSLPRVQADRRQLTQLFQNLISNAVKFRSHDRPVIDIDARQSDGEWEFSVADDGIGVDPTDAERVFRPFERSHRPGRDEGTGMGLAICTRIVERHGGRIWVEGRPGGGSVFSFTLPIPTAVGRPDELDPRAKAPSD
jgi:PAS domain S-box-containing protein